MESYLQDWLSLLLRWAHFITGIAWIGASFYFNWLENHLQRQNAKDPLAGDLWAVHGGGFYYLQKYKLAPDQLPATLHWFKWEAYFTWLTGFALMCIYYYANAQALRTLIERLRRQVQIAAEIEINQEAIVARKGRLAWPISEGRLASRFRGSEGDQDPDLHADGVLIEADEGSEVRAVHHGRVVYADWLRGFGLLLVIDHGDGYMTLYGHNQALLKEVGEWIATGEVIALTGASGGSGNRGLYFALRYQGKPLDPERWCRGRG